VNPAIKLITAATMTFVSITASAFAVVYDPTVASHVVAQTAKIVDEINILNAQLNSINQELQQLKSGQYQWSNAQDVINNLGNTMQRTNGLAYNASNLDQQFKQYFPGYQSNTNYTQFYQDLVNKTQNTLNGALQSAGSNANDFGNEQSRLNFLQKQVQNSQGQTQAIQAVSQIASEQVSQLQLLRQAVVTQTNAQTAYYAEQVQQQATARAEENQIINAGSTTAPDIGHSGQIINIPNS
jgi:P-type conjugative transfer protein TrbJ